MLPRRVLVFFQQVPRPADPSLQITLSSSSLLFISAADMDPSVGTKILDVGSPRLFLREGVLLVLEMMSSRM